MILDFLASVAKDSSSSLSNSLIVAQDGFAAKDGSVSRVGVLPDRMLPRLSRPGEVKLPLTVAIGKSKYEITGFLSQGAEGAVYLARAYNNPGEAVVIKAMVERHGAQTSFKNEYDALKTMNRLVAADEKNMIIVQPKI